MPHDKHRIAQRAGFIEKADGHRQRHQDAANEARATGRDRAADYHESRAATYSERLRKAAANIGKIAKDN